MKRFDKQLNYWLPTSLIMSILVCVSWTIIRDSFSFIDLLAIIIAVGICWLPVILIGKKWDEKKWNYLAEMESSSTFDEDFKKSVRSLHQAHRDEVLTEKELFEKLGPYLDVAQEVLTQKTISRKKEQRNKYFMEQVAKINKAYEDGIITEQERNGKIGMLRMKE